jgi:hypothetical protein
VYGDTSAEVTLGSGLEIRAKENYVRRAARIQNVGNELRDRRLLSLQGEGKSCEEKADKRDYTSTPC